MLIDAHQHYWKLARGDYHWMHDNPAVDPIRRDFLPVDLDVHRKAIGIDKTVLVQAADSTAETEFLLELAENHDSIAKVVGWIDFEDSSQINHLKRWARHPKFAGVRPMIQDIADTQWMHRADVQWAYAAIMDLDLTFDALGIPQHLQPFLQLFQRYPDMRVVIDHAMKPQIRDRGLHNWSDDFQRLADDTNAYCKCSGLLTEADSSCTLETLRPYLDHLFSVFPAQRLMWGSDWPVLNLAGNYADWWNMVSEYLTELPVVDGSDRATWLFSQAARDFYRI